MILKIIPVDPAYSYVYNGDKRVAEVLLSHSQKDQSIVFEVSSLMRGDSIEWIGNATSRRGILDIVKTEISLNTA